MKFEVLGEKKNPAIILIHGMFCDASSCMPFAEELQSEYYVIIPTLDAHYEGSEKLSGVTQQAEQIVEYLHREDIKNIAMLQGTSMGAEVALAVAKKCDIPIGRYFFDGGPFFHFSALTRLIMVSKFKKLVATIKEKQPEELIREPLIQKLGIHQLEQYKNMLNSMGQATKYITEDDIKVLVKICYCCKLPRLTKEISEKFVFYFASEEPARKSIKRLQKKYKNAVYVEMKGKSHCGFQTSEPKQYAGFLEKFIVE